MTTSMTAPEISLTSRPSSRASSSGGSRSGLRVRPQPKAMSASMEIWEIQKELKRGEMVQVLTTEKNLINCFLLFDSFCLEGL